MITTSIIIIIIIPQGIISGEYEGRTRYNVEWIFEGVLYFGWPNQPSSGTMGILHWGVFLCRILPEIRKTS